MMTYFLDFPQVILDPFCFLFIKTYHFFSNMFLMSHKSSCELSQNDKFASGARNSTSSVSAYLNTAPIGGLLGPNPWIGLAHLVWWTRQSYLKYAKYCVLYRCSYFWHPEPEIFKVATNISGGSTFPSSRKRVKMKIIIHSKIQILNKSVGKSVSSILLLNVFIFITWFSVVFSKNVLRPFQI